MGTILFARADMYLQALDFRATGHLDGHQLVWMVRIR